MSEKMFHAQRVLRNRALSKRVRGAAKSHQQRAQRRYAAIERENHLQKIADALRFSALRVEPPTR